MLVAFPNTYGDILLLYVVGLAVFFVIDMLWLGVVAKKFYARAMKDMLATTIRWNSAILFYLLFVAGLIIFAVIPALYVSNLVVATALGALYGFFTYMTYDLTNRATLAHWPLALVIVDITWGVIISTLVATSVYLAHFVVL